MSTDELRRAVFLDRDGVLNSNVFYADTAAYESPRTASDFTLCDGVPDALKRLRDAGFLLIVVSNQPNLAKGKSTAEELAATDQKLHGALAASAVALTATYYCYHHPEFTGPCECRKPEPYFLLAAARRFGIDLGRSWMVGDRATDVECGRRAGTRTVWINNDEGVAEVRAADLRAQSLYEAVALILAAR